MKLNDKKLRDLIETAAVKLGFTGVISISESGTPVFEKAYGFADRSNHVPNEVDTRFGTASGTKLFTALGVGRLIDSGEISLDSRLCDLVSYQFPNFSTEITVHHLLSHTSGVYDYYDEEDIEDFESFTVEIPWYQLTTPSDYLPLFQNEGMKFAPGERFSYSNGGYILLGIIIEEITGSLYREFITKEIFQVCGMDDSGFFPMDQLPERTAFGYIQTQESNWKTNFYSLPVIGASDGGAFTTAGDMQKLWYAFIHHQILSPNLTKAFMKPRQAVYKSEVSYGFGLYIWHKYNPPAYFIVGSDAGVGFDSRHWPKHGLTITILSNQTDGDSQIWTVIYDTLEPGNLL